MIEPPSLGGFDESIESYVNVIASDYKLHELLTPKLQLMSKQRRDLFGCESCIL